MSVTTVPGSTSYTPGQQTCATLVSQVLSFLQVPDDAEVKTVALAGMNSAVSLINSRTWKKLYSDQDITLGTTTDEYSVGSDFKEPIRLLTLNSSLKRTGCLSFIGNTEFYARYQDNTVSSSPVAYTVDYSSRVIVLNCVPSSSYVSSTPTLRLRYHRRAPRFTCTETSGLPPEFDDFIVSRGALWLARVRDPSKVQQIKSESDERWRDLKSDDNDTVVGYD